MHVRKFWLASLSVFLGVLFLGLTVVAPVWAQAVTRSYTTEVNLQRGMIVRKTEKDKTKVEALKAEQIEKMEGVVVAANDSPVTLTSDNATAQQVFVATTGPYNVLVSNQNGPIKKDDYVTISSLAGIGMKADGKQSRIVGKALSGFDGKTNISGKTTVKNSAKADIPITLGLVPVEIDVKHNPIEEKKTSLIPGLEFLQKAAGTVANNEVSATQLYISITALVLSAFISGSVLYAGIRASMTAVGRNPLAKSSIMKSLVSVVITSVIILIIGITAVYLILKL